MSALFLQYRPQTFTDVVGQTSVIRTLRNALKNDKPAHAYLFSGSRGTGKTSTARIFAKGLNCEHLDDGNPCGTCQLCLDIAAGNCVDVIEIDAASNRGIDEIRDLREKVNFAPSIAKRKVYIIDEVHMLTKEAFNALLKTLEEPPEHAFFILATTEMHKLPDTIISRCQTFLFHRFAIDQLVDRLAFICGKENFTADREALALVAKKAEGGLRDAISLLEQIAAETEGQITADAVRDSLGISSVEMLEQFWGAIEQNDTNAGLAVLQEISSSGRDFRTFGHDFLGFLREKLHANLTSAQALQTLLPAIEEIEKALSRLKTSPIVELPLEIAVVNLCGAGKISNKPPLKKGEDAKRQGDLKAPTPKQAAPKELVATEPKTEEPVAFEPAPALTETVSEAAQPTKEIKPKPPVAETPAPAAPVADDNAGFVFDGEPAAPAAKAVPTAPIIPLAAVQRTQQPLKSDTTSTPAATSVAISLDTIIDKMTDIAAQAGIPSFAKKSFLTTKPEFAGANKLVFYTDSRFHCEKLQAAAVRLALQNTIIDMFGERLMVDFATTKTAAKEEVATIDDFLNF